MPPRRSARAKSALATTAKPKAKSPAKSAVKSKPKAKAKESAKRKAPAASESAKAAKLASLRVMIEQANTWSTYKSKANKMKSVLEKAFPTAEVAVRAGRRNAFEVVLDADGKEHEM